LTWIDRKMKRRPVVDEFGYGGSQAILES
jgi:hypothetical protein